MANQIDCSFCLRSQSTFSIREIVKDEVFLKKITFTESKVSFIKIQTEASTKIKKKITDDILPK